MTIRVAQYDKQASRPFKLNVTVEGMMGCAFMA